MHNLAFEEAFPTVRDVARQKVLGAVGRCGLTHDDCDDVAGQLLMTFYTRFDRFDVDRASVRTFASRVMDKELNSILRYRLAGRRRHLGDGSLSGDVTEIDTECLSSGSAPPFSERQHFWLDFERALAPLPEVLRETALALCWHTFTMGRSDYQRQYEPILYGWKEGTDHFWCGARDQGDVWLVKKPVSNDLHPTMKPVELVERAVRNSSKSRDTVLDPFGGSGSTLIACERSGRQARLIELEPKYCDVIVRRFQEYAGKTAMLETDGRAFADVAAERLGVVA